MNSKELRIGNLVYDRSGKLLRIDWWENINKVCMDMNICGTQVHPLTEYPEFCKPIPLTKEWLLKFGWGRSDEHELCDNSNDIIFVYDWHFKRFEIQIDTEFNGFEYEVDIKYIHQLQNLYFALTGKELSYEDTAYN